MTGYIWHDCLSLALGKLYHNFDLFIIHSIIKHAPAMLNPIPAIACLIIASIDASEGTLKSKKYPVAMRITPNINIVQIISDFWINSTNVL